MSTLELHIYGEILRPSQLEHGENSRLLFVAYNVIQKPQRGVCLPFKHVSEFHTSLMESFLFDGHGAGI